MHSLASLFSPGVLLPAFTPASSGPGSQQSPHLRTQAQGPLWSLKLLLEWPCSQIQLPGRSFPRPKGSRSFSPPAVRPVYFSLVVTCVGTVWPLPLSSTRISVASLSYPLIVTQVSGRTVDAVALAILGMRSAHLLPRVWLPDCLSFASRAGTVGALSSATAWRRAVGARLEPPACCGAVVTAAAAVLAERGPQPGPLSRGAGPERQVTVCSDTKSGPTLQLPGLQRSPAPHHLLELARVHVH